MRASFGTRVFLALAGLVALATGATLVALQQLTSQQLDARFAERFVRAHRAFREMEELRLGLVAEEIESLARSHPQLRTVLSTASLSGDFGMGFGAETGAVDAAERDANLRLRSLLPSLTFAERSDVLIVLSSAGVLLYSAAEPTRYGDDLSELAVFRSTLRSGRSGAIWVAPGPQSLPRLLPAEPEVAVYRVLARPVVFGEELHGVVLSGRRIDVDILASTRAVSGLEAALVARDRVVATTLSAEAAQELARRLSSLPDSAGVPAAAPLELAGAPYRVGRAELSPETPLAEAGFVLLGPVEAEWAFLRRLRLSILGVGGLVLLAALVPAFALARGITRPVTGIARAARGIGAGRFETRVDVQRSDEVGELGRAFNEMAAGLEERERIRRTFERYVSREVAEEVLRHPEKAQPAGVRRELTVAFVDLAGFSAWAEASEPEVLVAGLSEYFEVVCEAVLASDGTVNEFLGDGVVAFWGAPLPQPDHALRACRAALRCRAGLGALVERWRREDRPRVDFRIGVHSGELVVGEVGAAERRAYRAVGDAMNVASRVEGAGRSYGTRLLVSDAVVARVGGALLAREVDRVRVVGRREALGLFELVAETSRASEAQREWVASWQQALGLYRAGDFGAAEARLRGFLEQHPDDGPAAVFLERARRYRAEAPEPGWDGVHELREK